MDLEELHARIVEYSKLSKNFKLSPMVLNISQTVSNNSWGKVVSYKNRPPNKQYKRI